MTPPPPQITIIIPTLAEAHRFKGLQRAIKSIQNNESANSFISICVVVNGKRFDESVMQWLYAQKLIVVQIPEASLPLALFHGKCRVRTKYFGFLDDDDEYLPGALNSRFIILEKSPHLDIVISNGYKYLDGIDTLALKRLKFVTSDPLTELFKENWIGSCTALFRSESFPNCFFELIRPYLEWSHLGFQIAINHKRIGIIDTPTFRINDTPGSASKSEAYQDAHIDFYRYVLTHNLPSPITKLVGSRLQDAWALRALYAMHASQFDVALSSLREVATLPRFWRYAPLALRIVSRSVLAKIHHGE